MKNSYWLGIFGAATAIAGGIALYYLAQDEEEKEVVYDPKIHTKEKLIEIMREFEIEYASLFLHWYSMLRVKEKELGKGKIPPEILNSAKQQIEKLTENVDAEVCDLFQINKAFLDQWLEKHGNEPEIKSIKNKIESNFNKLIEIQRPEFNFTYPKDLTKDKYIKFIKVAYAKFRYDIYKHVQKVLKETDQTKLSDDEFNDALKKCSLPEIKIMTYKRMGLPEVPGEKSTRTALKAYLMMMEEDEAWHKEVLHIQKEHKNILFSIPEGKKLENVYEDPLDYLDKEMKYEVEFEKKQAEEEKKKLENDEKINKAAKADKKPAGSFSFLGNQTEQQKLVEEFLNRNKKQPPKSEAKAEELPQKEEVEELPQKEQVEELPQKESVEEGTVSEIDEPQIQEESKEDVEVHQNDDKELLQEQADAEDNTAYTVIHGISTNENPNEEPQDQSDPTPSIDLGNSEATPAEQEEEEKLQEADPATDSHPDPTPAPDTPSKPSISNKYKGSPRTKDKPAATSNDS